MRILNPRRRRPWEGCIRIAQAPNSRLSPLPAGWCIQKHVLIANVMYNIGLVMFVRSLRKPYIYQFGQFAWTHMILLIVFLQVRLVSAVA